MITHDTADLRISGVPRPLTLNRHDDRFRRVLLKKGQDFIYNWPESLLTSQGNGKNAMNKIQSVFGRVQGAFRLYTDVEETDTIGELLTDRRYLAANRWKSAMIGR